MPRQKPDPQDRKPGGQQHRKLDDTSRVPQSTLDRPDPGVWCPACLQPATYLRRLDRFVHDQVLSELGIDPTPHTLPRDHRDAADLDDSLALHDALDETHGDCWWALATGRVPEAAWPRDYMPWIPEEARRGGKAGGGD